MASLPEVEIIITRAAAAHGQTVTDGQVRAYHSVLGHYPRLVLVQAVTQILAAQKWFPKASEVAEVAYDVNTRYAMPPGCEFDEAAKWHMYVNNYTSTDDLTPDDIQRIYKRLRNAPDWMTPDPVAVPKQYIAEVPA